MTIQTNLTGLDLRAEIDRLRKERNAVILAAGSGSFPGYAA